MSLLSIARQMLRTFRYRRAVRSLTELDNRMLADIGLLRTDVYAALARPSFADNKALKNACCHWRAHLTGFRLSSDPAPCC